MKKKYSSPQNIRFECGSKEINIYEHFSLGRKITIFQLLPNVIGGGPFNFADIERCSIQYLKYGKKAPKWRMVEDGLNLFWVCKNKSCQAFNKEVIHKVGYTDNRKDGYFEINGKIAEITCPMCKKIISLRTCGLANCEYEIVGDKIEGREIKHYDSTSKETPKDKFEYFNPYKGDKFATWTSLKMYVFNIQKIKYKGH